MKGLPKLLLPILLLATTSNSLRSQALYPVALDEKVKNSTLIVEGKVESQESFWNQSHSMIFTASKLGVYKVFEGTVLADHIQVLTQGGSVDNYSIDVSDQLQLDNGETGMFFCFPNQLKLVTPSSGEIIYDVYSSSQGCYKYDLMKMSASVPFDRFSSITKGLYPAIINLTGKPIIDNNPSVSFDPTQAITGAGLESVTSFSPLIVNAGALLQPDSNLLTITGSGFGSPTDSAAILFDNADDGTGGTPYTLAFTSNLVVSWTDTEIKVRVPTKAGTGLFSVRTSNNTFFSSGVPLTVNYAVLTGTFATVNTLQRNLMSTNGLGGYDIVYSTNTAGLGRNLNTSPEKATFQRALTTWKQICGANINEAGTTANQVIAPGDKINTIMLDNKNTGVAVLPTGVLASTYNGTLTCTSGGQYHYPAQASGFDVLLRNTGVSTGTVNFTVGPCPPVTNVAQYDLETVILHELGHAISLGHINDGYEGSQLPFINPPKLLYYGVPNGVRRISPDYSAKTGADYNMKPKGLTYGSCISGFTEEMTPLATILESKDECPLFPLSPTVKNTQIDFDLVHATSNKNVDPQYTALNCTGLGTGVTNTAFTAIKTSNSDGALTISVNNYAITPAAQANCSLAGIELSLYKVNSCPEGQNFPDPVACRTFNANGVLADFNLVKNANYLLVVDGIANTKAKFSLLLNGIVLPVKIKDFYGNILGADNRIFWEFDALTEVGQVNLERSIDGHSFETISSWNSSLFALKGNYTDKLVSVSSYYRLLFVSRDGEQSYSNVINLNRTVSQSWHVYPNPAKAQINLFATNVSTGKYTARVFTSTGILVLKQVANITASAQLVQLPAIALSSGNYRVIVSGQNGEVIYSSNVTIVK